MRWKRFNPSEVGSIQLVQMEPDLQAAFQCLKGRLNTLGKMLRQVREEMFQSLKGRLNTLPS